MKLSGDHIVFIGTGPLSLLKAYLVGQKNPAVKITLIEMGNRIGGAWYSDKSPKGYEIECGCHIWSYVPEVYDYLERELDIPLYELNPGAFFIGKLKVPYSLKNTITQCP